MAISEGAGEVSLKDESPASLAAQGNIDIGLAGPVTEEISQGGFDDAYRFNASLKAASVEAEELLDPVAWSGETTGPEEVALSMEEEGIPEISIGLEDAAVEETGTDPVLPEQDSTREILFDMDLPASEGPQIED
ncbi:MAG: hypothetical protein GY849_08190, partial [Deltaproteobacteria bacterium]|nr:hypothetical protein [Deltaproteobacteria bacterium]